MSEYTLPTASFQQEFQTLAQAAQQTLYTCVVGPRRKVVKDGLSPESEFNYGAYDPDTDTEHNFLALPAGERVDDGSVDVRLRNVYALYASLSGSNVIEATGVANEIKLGAGASSGQRLAAFDNGTASHDRLTALGGRDVRVGDYVKVVHEDGTLLTQVTGLVQEQSSVSVDVTDAATVNDSINPATQTAGVVVAVVDDMSTGRTTSHYGAQSVAYGGDLAKGLITDTYTLEITKAGALGTAEFKVISAGGDNATGVVTPVDNSTAVAIGANGLEITMDDADGAFVLGEKWTVTAKAAYTQKTLSLVGSATYGGLIDTTYQIKVIKGGAYADSPKVSITTNNNVDSSGAVVVGADEVDIQLGSLGPVVEFDDSSDPQGGLRLGDIYNVKVTAAKDDGARTMQLKAPLPQFDSGGDTINASGYDLSVSLLVKQDSHVIPATEYPDPGSVNWELGSENRTIDLKSGIKITDSSVVDGSGDLVSLPVVQGTLSIYYTAALALEGNKSGIVTSLSQVESVLGDVVPENNVAFGVDMALRNSGGVPVYYFTTAGDSTEDYSDALGEAEKNDDLYFITPMSHDIDVQSLTKSHVINMSSETNGLERIAIVNRTVAGEQDLFVTKDDDTTWTGYIAAGPELSPTQYRTVTIPGATFVTTGVQPGDVLKTNFSIAVGGNETFESYIVESIIDEENLLIATGPEGPVGSVGSTHRIEITHPYTSLEKAQLAAAQSEFFGDRRVTNIFPDEFITTGGDTVPGYYLAAAYAGLKSSVVAHQPITNMEISGVLSVPRVLNGFNRSELNEIAGGGTTIIAQETEGGQVFVRHSITTDMSDVNQSELAITTNVDAITKYLRRWIKPLIGQYNITPEFLIMIETLAAQRLDLLIQETQTVKAGPQIIEVGPILATQDKLVRTKVLMSIPLELPYAANNIVTKLVIV